MYRTLSLFLLLIAGCRQPDTHLQDPDERQQATPPLLTESFEFEVNGNRLVGLLDMPAGVEPTATIIIVHGYGETNVVEQSWYYEMRSKFAEIGLNTIMWDKPGCGKSEGEFDINQPVQSSAQEVVEAVHAVQELQLAGSEAIGLWGISRAGWIAPLAMHQEPEIDFWISVSGTDDKENARYLIESNLRIEGRSEAEIEVLLSEWQARFNVFWQGGTYEEYLNTAPTLSEDDFIKFMGWDGYASEQEFLDYRNAFLNGDFVVDEDDELMIHVPNFTQVLESINKPVLALFGEKDTNVDWRKTMALYQETIGANPKAPLTIITFPDADHNLRQSKTGGIREFFDHAGNAPYTEGYYDSMIGWLVEHRLGVEQ